MQAARLHARQAEIQFREATASPTQSQMRAAFGPIHTHQHFFQKSTQKLLAIAIRGGRGAPNFVQIGAESENFLSFVLTLRARALFFPPLEFGFGGSQIA
jgi:hypothetical protein